jgi:hypothetical protein
VGVAGRVVFHCTTLTIYIEDRRRECKARWGGWEPAQRPTLVNLSDAFQILTCVGLPYSVESKVSYTFQNHDRHIKFHNVQIIISDRYI